MKTICIQIGNTDNKLSQQDWSRFIKDTSFCVDRWKQSVYFCGFSNPIEIWQNAAWIFSIQEDHIELFKKNLNTIRENYVQDSIAYLEGDTIFIK